MKDIFGKTINVNDYFVYGVRQGSWQDLHFGQVVEIKGQKLKANAAERAYTGKCRPLSQKVHISRHDRVVVLDGFQVPEDVRKAIDLCGSRP